MSGFAPVVASLQRGTIAPAADSPTSGPSQTLTLSLQPLDKAAPARSLRVIGGIENTAEDSFESVHFYSAGHDPFSRDGDLAGLLGDDDDEGVGHVAKP